MKFVFLINGRKRLTICKMSCHIAGVEIYVGRLIEFEDFWVNELGQKIPKNLNMMIDLFHEYPNYEGYSDLVDVEKMKECIKALEAFYNIVWIDPLCSDKLGFGYCVLVGRKIDHFPKVSELTDMGMRGIIPPDSRVYFFKSYN